MMHAVIALAVLSPLLAGSMPRLEDAQLGTFLTEVYGKRPVERPAEMAFADLYPPDNWRGSVPNDTVNRYSRGGFVMVDPSVRRLRVRLQDG